MCVRVPGGLCAALWGVWAMGSHMAPMGAQFDYVRQQARERPGVRLSECRFGRRVKRSRQWLCEHRGEGARRRV